ncbi:MAG: hypothetical protein WAW06_01760, partial [bacterium]
MTERGRVRHLWLWLTLAAALGAGVPGACAAGLEMSPLLRDRPSCQLVSDGSVSLSPVLSPVLAAPADTTGVLVAAGAGGQRHNRLMGCSLFGSGLFLCSWGIVSWETSESQCCPTRNTQ